MVEKHFAILRNHQGSTLLPGVTLAFALAQTFLEAVDAVGQGPPSDGGEHPSGEFGFGKYLQGWVGIDRAAVVGALAESSNKLRAPRADYVEAGVVLVKRFDMRLQLQHMLAAVDSAKVSYKYQYRVGVVPE